MVALTVSMSFGGVERSAGAMTFVAGSEGRGLGAPPSPARVAPSAQPDRARAVRLKPLIGLIPYVLRYRWRVAGACVTLVVAAIVTLLVPLAVRRMIDVGFSAERG